MGTLSELSNAELISSFKYLKTKEDLLLGEILEHIAEIDRRRLYLELGFPSLYAYLTKEMGYSDGEAFRRLDSSRFLTAHPQLKPMVNNGKLNLTSILEINTAVRSVEKSTGEKVSAKEQVTLALDVAGTSKLETQKILADRLPDYKPMTFERRQELIDGGIQIVMRMNKIQRKKSEASSDILARKGPIENTAHLVEQLCDYFLSKKDLTGPMEPELFDDPPLASSKPETQRFVASDEEVRQARRAKALRQIPAATRRSVFRRDRGRCQFRKSNGEICGVTRDVHIDHIIPVSKGGNHNPANLRCLCRAHNLWKSDGPAETGRV